jgi:hypothetical protein
LLPFREALRSVAQTRGISITIVVVAPPYPSAGTGPMRVVRVGRSTDVVALTASYEGYVRL